MGWGCFSVKFILNSLKITIFHKSQVVKYKFEFKESLAMSQ